MSLHLLPGVSLFIAGCLAAAQAPFEAGHTRRLAALGKLWATAKCFHPYLAYQDIDWDAALIAALPKASAAKNPGEYAAAVQLMLDYLADPATRVQPAPAPRRDSAAGPQPLSQTTDDGILILAIAPGTAAHEGASVAALRQAGAAIAGAKAVIFDLRASPQAREQTESVGTLFVSAGLNNQLAFTTLKLPAQRSRMHSGLGPPAGNVFYHSAFYVRDGATLETRPGARPRPVVFLVNEHSELPPIAAALQAAGKAAIVAEDGVSDASLVQTHRIDLPDGVRVSLRVTELVYEDGTTGLTPDMTVAAGQGLAAALDLARNPGKAGPPARRKLPPYAVPPPERAYAGQEYPPVEYRLLAGFRIWAVFQYFFAYRHLMGEDWDAVLCESLPKLEQAANGYEYALAIAEMVAHVHDSHSAFIGSRALAEDLFGSAQPPIRTRIIEGVPVVTALLDEQAARSAGLTIGDVILKVDGEEAGQRLGRLGRYVAASTPQSRDNILMQRWLNGDRGTTLRLTIRDAQKRVRQVELRRDRSARAAVRWRDGDILQVLPGNIGYADLDRLPAGRVDEMFERFRHTRAIIFDMRGYPQGTAWRIAPRLTDRKAVVAARFRRPLALFPEGRWGDISSTGAAWEFVQYIPESDQWKYKGRTVMLIDERAMSQAEHTGLFLEAANGTKFIGSPTAGANGDVARFSVPGGITVSFSGHDVRHADGRQLQRIGLIPHIVVRPTIAGIRAGRDEVLEKALEYLGVSGVKLRKVGEAR